MMTLLIVLFLLILFNYLGLVVLYPISKLFSSRTFYDVFKNLTVGLLTAILFYAVYITHGKTVLLITIIPALFVLYHSKNQKNTINVVRSDNKRFVPIIAMLLLGLVFFLFQGYFFYNQPFNNVVHGDYQYYARVIEYLNSLKTESNLKASYLFIDKISATPYHYAELWLVH